MQEVGLLQGVVYGWEADGGYIWQDDAACAFKGAGLFEYNDKLTKAENQQRSDQAVAICQSCPVRQDCLESADYADLQWTIRGGKPFGQLSSATIERGVKCRAGHDDWFIRKDKNASTSETFRCKPCHRESVNKAKVKKRLRDHEAAGTTPRRKNDTTKPCPVCGHTSWTQWAGGGVRCKPCDNYKRQVRRRRGGADGRVIA